MPLLQKAKDQGQEARVLTVLHPSRGAPLDPNNLGLKKNYSLGLAAGQGITYNNLMVEVREQQPNQIVFPLSLPGFGLTERRTPMLGVLETVSTIQLLPHIPRLRQYGPLPKPPLDGEARHPAASKGRHDVGRLRRVHALCFAKHQVPSGSILFGQHRRADPFEQSLYVG